MDARRLCSSAQIRDASLLMSEISDIDRRSKPDCRVRTHEPHGLNRAVRLRSCRSEPMLSSVVKRIHEQLVPTGASVRESVELPERGSGTLREVDVLIEYAVLDSPTRIAVECRDPSRASDIQWVESSCSLVSAVRRFYAVFGRSWTEVGLKCFARVSLGVSGSNLRVPVLFVGGRLHQAASHLA